MSGDQIGVPGCESRAEPPCTVGAAARHGPRLKGWLTEVLRLKSTIFTTVDGNQLDTGPFCLVAQLVCDQAQGLFQEGPVETGLLISSKNE